jgi:translation initiation factor IF-2
MSDTTPIQLPSVLTVKQLADELNQPVTTVIGKLMGFGVLATINEDIDFDTAAIVADDLGFTVTRKQETQTAVEVKQTAGSTKNAQQRPAIVTIMGHVDHGKTTLLDTIRKTNVAAGESGGITQHISSYQIDIQPKSGGEKRTITFLDTPGHSAFEAMRRHGAQITDLVVLVVAADDGIKPQTVEAINHAREMQVPVLVAINKVDKPDADLDKVKGQLAEHDLTPEDWGGKTITVPVSALQGKGIDELLDMILLSTDLRELKANYEVPAVGVVVESNLKPGIGPVATVLIQNGVAKVGDFIAIGSVSGRIRTLTDYRGKKIVLATPSMPVALSGLSGLPNFGEQFAVFPTEKEARESARNFLRTQSAKRASGSGSNALHVTAQKEGDKSIMNVVVKADAIGSLEAIRSGLQQLKNDYVEVRIIGDGVGDISEGDITRAQTGSALVLGFHVRVPAAVKTLADREKVTVSLYSVVYELFDAIRAALNELMPYEEIEVPVGTLKILARFRDNRKNVVLGGRVEEGLMEPKRQARVVRGEKEVAIGKVVGVRRGRDEVRSVGTGSECGLELELSSGAADVKVNDVVMSYRIEQQRIPLGL